MRLMAATLALAALTGCAQMFEAMVEGAVDMAFDVAFDQPRREQKRVPERQGPGPMKRILDSDFHYRPSYDTNIKDTFERARREQQQKDRKVDGAQEASLRLVKLERQSR